MAKAAFRFLFIYFVLATGLYISVTGQSKLIDLTQEIPLIKGRMPLYTLLTEITRHSHLVFTYDASKIKTSSFVTVKSNKLTLLEIFSLLRTEASLDCKLVEDHVILVHVKPAQNLAQPSTLGSQPKKQVTKQEAIVPVKKNQADTLPQKIDQAIEAFASRSIQSEPVFVPSIKMNTEQDTVRKLPALAGKDTIVSNVSRASLVRNQSPKEPARNFKMPTLIAKVGLSIDETSTFGANVHLGIPFIYGTASWQTSTNISHYRLGSVASFPLNKNLNLILGFNTGKLQKTYVVDSVWLSQKYLLSVKSSLARYSVFLEFPVSGKLKIQIGPQLNLLKTVYYRESVPINLLSIGSNASDTYFTMKAPYAITKELQPPSTYILNWIGVHVSIYYKINLLDL